ncbi:MAG: AI-2E family transporter, partial [Pseudonocardiaceae bacterium]
MGFTGALGVLLVWVLYQALVDVWSMLVLIGVSAFLAIALNPAVTWMQRWRLPRGLAVAVVALAALGFLVGLVFAIGPPIVDQGGQLIEKAPGYIEDLKNNKTINDLNERFNLIDRLKEAASGDMLSGVFGGVIGGLGILASAVFNILTGFVLTLYFLASFNRLKSGAYKLVPASRRERVQLLGDEMLGRIGKYLSGALAIALIAGVSTLIFAEITDIPYAFALAMVVAITDLIPQIGATLGAVVVSAVAFTVSVPVGIAAIVFFIAYQQVENFLIYPKVMKRAVNVSDLAAIVSALIGAALLGVVGALLAIPVCAAVQLLVREVFL